MLLTADNERAARAAEKVIYTRSSRRLDMARARGVQHALMWAQYATTTPPSRSQGPDH